MSNEIYEYEVHDETRRADPMAVYRDIYRVCPSFDELYSKLKTDKQFQAMSVEDKATIGAEALDAEEAMVQVSRAVFKLEGDIGKKEEYVNELTAISILYGFFHWLDEKKVTTDSEPTSDTGTETESSTNPTPNNSDTGSTSLESETATP